MLWVFTLSMRSTNVLDRIQDTKLFSRVQVPAILTSCFRPPQLGNIWTESNLLFPRTTPRRRISSMRVIVWRHDTLAS